MSEWVRNIEAAIEARTLLKPRQSVLVAVSGGLDSMVLLEVLGRLAGAWRWRLCVAHVNHRLRGRSSDADERLVKAAAERLGIPCEVERADTRAAGRVGKLSMEMAARQIRHDFLARVARRRAIPTIALAHHADDQVELFFLRLLRGAGGEGLRGMKWLGVSPVDPLLGLVRPLLGCFKADLRTVAEEEKIRFREDASNASVDILRNRVRHELLPMLARDYQPAISRVILRQMDLVNAEVEFLDESARRWQRARSPEFRRLPAALQRRLLKQELVRLRIAPEFELIERLRCAPGTKVAVAFSPQAGVSHDGEGRLRRVSTLPVSFQAGVVELDLTGTDGRGRFDGLSWSWEVRASRGLGVPAFRAGCEWFDADKVGTKVLLRHWQPGDRFQPIGMEAPVKLQDLFTNQKIPRGERRLLTVGLTAGGEIWWVEGLRISEGYKLLPGTRRRLRWCWERPAGTRDIPQRPSSRARRTR